MAIRSKKRDLMILYIGFIFISSFLLGAAPEMADEKTALSNVNTLFINGDFDGAILQITDFINKFPESSHKDQALFLLGESHYKKTIFRKLKKPTSRWLSILKPRLSIRRPFFN